MRIGVHQRCAPGCSVRNATVAVSYTHLYVYKRQAFIKRKYNLLIGERTAEQIKIEIGSDVYKRQR